MPKRGLAALADHDRRARSCCSASRRRTTPSRPSRRCRHAADQGTGAITPRSRPRRHRARPGRAGAARPRRRRPTRERRQRRERRGTSALGKTVDGPVVSTRFGDVQVEVVVAGGKVTDVVALQLPTGRRSGQISRLRRADPAPGGAPGAECEHRPRVRRDLHQRRLRAVAPVGARPGRGRDDATATARRCAGSRP